MIKIEMRDDSGELPTGLFNTHVCVGNLFECETPAFCEECGAQATAERAVYVWRDDQGNDYLICCVCVTEDPHMKAVES